MKNILILISVIFFQQIALSQNITDYTNQIINLIAQNNIETYDNQLNQFNNSILLNQIISKDTVINCQWTRPRYYDNIYQKGFDGISLVNRLELDTISYINDKNYIAFTYKKYDENDNFSKIITLFLINREYKTKIKNPQKLNIEKEYLAKWKVVNIIQENRKIKLDSCHFLYRLEFKNNNNFSQYYLGTKSIQCSTNEMENHILTGVENDNIFDYSYKLQGHYLSISQGKWKLYDNKLLLEDKKGFKILTFEVYNLTRTKMCLKVIDTKIDYKIEFVKTEN